MGPSTATLVVLFSGNVCLSFFSRTIACNAASICTCLWDSELITLAFSWVQAVSAGGSNRPARKCGVYERVTASSTVDSCVKFEATASPMEVVQTVLPISMSYSGGSRPPPHVRENCVSASGSQAPIAAGAVG